jgi:arsenite-transporting ATPase
MKFLENPPANLFFTGKGGVGKTSASCSVAVALADAGKKVLLVSTDPASNIDEIFGEEIGNEPGLLSGVEGLWALNVDPVKAAEEYRCRDNQYGRAAFRRVYGRDCRLRPVHETDWR